MKQYVFGALLIGSAAGAAFLGGACGGSADIQGSGSGQGGSGASSGTGGSSTTTTGTGGASSSSSSAGGGTTTSTSTGGCSVAPGDSACTSCVKTNCCSDVTACQADMNCVCWMSCFAANPGNIQTCLQQCGAPDATTQALGQCAQGPCQADCQGGGGGAGGGTTTSSSTVACAMSPNDSVCLMCAKQNCCAQFTACEADAKCTCWAVCNAQNPNNPLVCAQQCGAPDATTQALGQCVGQACQGKCP